jgi:copper(I)-binding protein
MDKLFSYALCSFVSWILANSVWAEPGLLEEKNAWIKLAPPGANVNAAYLNLYNSSAQPVEINKLESNCCEEVVLHRTYYENDRVKMEHLDKLVIPAKSALQLKPGGLHIMLLRASPAFRLGDKVKINILFSDGQKQNIHFLVKASADEKNQ